MVRSHPRTTYWKRGLAGDEPQLHRLVVQVLPGHLVDIRGDARVRRADNCANGNVGAPLDSGVRRHDGVEDDGVFQVDGAVGGTK